MFDKLTKLNIMNKIFFLVLFFIIGGTLIPQTVNASIIETRTNYDSDVIQDVEELGELAAEAGLRVFNTYSMGLDMVLFGYYSSAFDKRKGELNSSSGGSGNSIGEIEQLQAKEDHTDLFEAFFRTYSWMFK